MVRVFDISKFLAVKKSSVCGALSTLAGKKLVIHKCYGKITLTQKGFRIAKGIQEKHKFLTKFFSTILGVTPEIASEDACNIEHTISSEGFDRLTKFLEFIEDSSKKQKPEWLEGFHCYCKVGKRRSHRARIKKEKVIRKK